MNKIILLPPLLFGIISCDDNKTVQSKHPNVIIIFTDNQGYQDLGSYGSPDIETPHLDKMAREGIDTMHLFCSYRKEVYAIN